MAEKNDPLAGYTERLPQVKRTFRLYKDRVEIDAAWTLGKNYKSVVRLETLTPEVKKFFVRNRWFKRAILIGSLAVAVAVVFTRGGYPEWVERNAMFGWVVASACAVIAFTTFPKRQFVRFSRKDGRPGLDICRSGRDAVHFDDFVHQVQRRIRNA